MKEAIRLRDVALAKGATGLTLSVHPGQLVAIVGPAGAAKSQMLRVATGIEKPARGEVRLAGEAIFAEGGLHRKSTPQALARSTQGQGQATRASEALNATRLWDLRQDSIAEFANEQLAACELLGLLSARAPVLAIDLQLDRLDPWALQSTLDLIRARRREGAAVIAVTNRPDIAAAADWVIALDTTRVRFSGSPAELLGTALHEIEVAAESQPGVRALVEPFEVQIEAAKDGKLLLRATEGQALAARLLLEGYGNVRYVALRPPTFEEALLKLMR